MGKHKDKSKKHSKEREKHKKHKKKHRKRETSSSSSEEEVWVEKESRKRSYSSSSSENEHISHKKPIERMEERDEWMSLQTSFKTISNSDRRSEREANKQIERDKQIYNPQECSRELNPYWKDGGDGLPSFKKPTDDVYEEKYKPTSSKPRTSNWRKKPEEKIQKAIPETATVTKSDEVTKSNDEALSDKEMNLLASKIIKAEIMGNTKLVNELKQKLENAKKLCENNANNDSSEDVILTHMDSTGRILPLKSKSDHMEPSGSKNRKKNMSTHSEGQRVRYFADDDKYSLKEMFENEKFNTVEDQASEFIKMASKVAKNDDMDDVFTDKIRQKGSDAKVDEKNLNRAINEHKKVSKSLDNCKFCIQSDLMLKHLMISMGETVYLSLPPFEPLTDGHCLIIPIRHVPCATQLDENEWEDILDFRRALTKLFNSRGEDVVFFETAVSLYKFSHMVIECVPLPKEEGDMAPIYFKKAIDESETEWAQNKKLISLAGKNVRKAVPKGLPYFTVSFGLTEGYAHVIEDEKLFPTNFAQEIIGGMLDLDHRVWRKPKRQSFEDQSRRVLEFNKEWSRFDCTVK